MLLSYKYGLFLMGTEGCLRGKAQEQYVKMDWKAISRENCALIKKHYLPLEQGDLIFSLWYFRIVMEQ